MLRSLRRHIHRSLQRQLVVSLGLVGLVPIVALLMITLPMMRSHMQEQSAADFNERARVLSMGVGLMLDEAIGEINQLANDSVIRNAYGSEAALTQALELLSQTLMTANGRFYSLQLLDLSGESYGFVGERHAFDMLGMLSPPWRRDTRAQTGQERWVSEIVRCEVPGMFLIAFSCAVRDLEDKPVGHMVATYDAYRVLAQTVRMTIGTHGLAGLLSRSGRLVYSQSGLVENRVHEELEPVMAQRQARTYVGPLLRDDDTDYLIAYTPLIDRETVPSSLARLAPLAVVVAEPHSSVLARANPIVQRTLLGGLLVLFVLCVAASIVSRQLSDPLRHLTAKVRSLGAQTPDLAPQDDQHELEVLQNAFQAMAARVQEQRTALQERNLEMQQVCERLETANRLKDEFLSFLSHEVRTPLAAIRSFAELIRITEDMEEENRLEFLTIIESETERLSRLCNDLLDLAKIDSGDMPWRNEVVDAAELMQSALRTLTVLAVRGNIHLHFQQEPDLPPLVADPDRLTQLFTNLISNALKFTPPGGQVTVRLARHRDADEEALLISIRDTGPGIPVEYLDRIFDRFVQAHGRDPRGQPGSGLGLTICKRVVEKYGGTIRAENCAGGGAAFHVSFPIQAASPLDVPESAEAPANAFALPLEKSPGALDS